MPNGNVIAMTGASSGKGEATGRYLAARGAALRAPFAAAATVARPAHAAPAAILHAIEEPDAVDVGEIVIRQTAQA